MQKVDVFTAETMTPDQLFTAINTAIDCQTTCYTWGHPGTGKSDIHRQVAAHRGMEIRDIRLSYMEPVDVHGMPTDKDGWLDWLLPKFLKPRADGKPVMLFLDEMGNASDAVQAAAYQLALDRCMDEFKVPDDWAICAAGNYETDGALANPMSTALANRMMHFYLLTGINEWVKWASINGIHEMVIAFLMHRPELLFKFDPQSAEQAYPSPRSWEFMSRLVNRGIKPSMISKMYGGTVGAGAAKEFMAFQSMYQTLDSIPSILADPLNVTVPTEVSKCYALAVGLAMHANKDNMDAVMAFAQRFERPEYLQQMVTLAKNRDPKIQFTKAFRDWAVDNATSF